MPTIGVTRMFATLLAAIAQDRADRGEGLFSFIEADAGYLRENLPGTSDAMRSACADARRMVMQTRVRARQEAPPAA